MKNDFSNSSNNYEKVTVHELDGKIALFVADLNSKKESLQENIQRTRAAHDEIQEEYFSITRTFVSKTISDIASPVIRTLSDIALNIPTLSGQSLSYFTQNIIDRRTAALSRLNDDSEEKLDVAGFRDAYNLLKQKESDAQQTAESAKGDYDSACRELGRWQSTDSYQFVKKAKELADAGARPLTPENGDYYAPKDIFSAAYQWVARNDLYRQVRDMLVEYDHGENGKDFFGDLNTWRAKDSQLWEVKTAAENSYQQAASEAKKLEEYVNVYDAIASDLYTDAEILKQIQDKVTEYFKTPEFVQAVAKQLNEIPLQTLPLLEAKLSALSKLESSAERKVSELETTIENLERQKSKLSRMRPYDELDVDMNALENNREIVVSNYGQYINAADRSLSRTTSYAYEPGTTVVYHDNSPSFFDIILLNELLRPDHHCHDHTASSGSVVPSTTSYAADLLQVDDQQKSAGNLPAFDIIPSVANDDFDIIPSNGGGTYTSPRDDRDDNPSPSFSSGGSSSHS